MGLLDGKERSIPPTGAGFATLDLVVRGAAVSLVTCVESVVKVVATRGLGETRVRNAGSELDSARARRRRATQQTLRPGTDCPQHPADRVFMPTGPCPELLDDPRFDEVLAGALASHGLVRQFGEPVRQLVSGAADPRTFVCCNTGCTPCQKDYLGAAEKVLVELCKPAGDGRGRWWAFWRRPGAAS